MNENTNTVVETLEVPKKRGNPNWGKKDNIIKASVTFENKVSSDIWHVGNKDPSLHYHWARKSDDIEMNNFAQKGYTPACKNEHIMGDPFAAVKDTTGESKIRGDRILMCCPKNDFDARKQKQLSRYVSANESARNDARKMSGKGVLVQPETEETTKRESLEE